MRGGNLRALSPRLLGEDNSINLKNSSVLLNRNLPFIPPRGEQLASPISLSVNPPFGLKFGPPPLLAKSVIADNLVGGKKRRKRSKKRNFSKKKMFKKIKVKISIKNSFNCYKKKRNKSRRKKY